MNNNMNNNGKRNFRRFNNKGGGSNRHRHNGPRFSSNSEDGSDINPQMRRNFEMKRNTHLAKAKELLSAGERVDAEYHMQHADHYFRMANLGLDKQRTYQPYNQQPNNGQGNEHNSSTAENSGSNPGTDSAPPADDLRFISDAPPSAEKTPPAAPGIADLPFMQS